MVLTDKLVPLTPRLASKNYYLLSDLIAQYPPGFPVKTDPRIAELEKEVEILRGLLRR